MKLNVAFHTLLVAISAASGAHARATSFLRDPRTVEGKEPVKRQTMGEFVTKAVEDAKAGHQTCKAAISEEALKLGGDYPTDKQRSQACANVSAVHHLCRGCQGYSQMGKEVHIPACVGMTLDECKNLAGDIVTDKPGWFKNGSSTDFTVVDEEIDFPSEMAYYKIGLPVETGSSVHPENGTKDIKSLAGDCMVQYQWDWCVDLKSNEEGTTCLQLPAWDCSIVEGDSASGCLSAYECCAKIQGLYPKPDINGNELQCYEWELPMTGTPTTRDPNATTGPTSSGPSNPGPHPGPTGDILVIHMSGGKVALPAVITDEITDATREAVDNEEVMQPDKYYIGYDTGGCLKQNYGDDYKPVVDECAAYCDTDSECVSFEYKKEGTDTAGNNCKLSKTCGDWEMTEKDITDDYMWYLKVDDYTATVDKAAKKGVAYLWVLANVKKGWVSPPPGVTSTKYYTGYDTGGCPKLNDHFEYKPTVQGCAAACDAFDGCISFEFKKEGTNANGKNCVLSTGCTYLDTVKTTADDYMWYWKSDEYTGHEDTAGNAYLWLMNPQR